MAARGYQNYHGKRNGKRILLVVALVLVLVLASAFLVLQEYIVYDSSGNISLDLPFLHRDEDTGTQSAGGEHLPIEIIEPEDTGAPGEAGGFAVEEQTLYDFWEEKGPAPGPGTQGLVSEVKGESGTFYYQSDWAVEGATDAHAVSRSGIAALLDGQRDWSAVAAVHCFRDDYYAMHDMAGAGICQPTGYIWFGMDNSHWLEPSKERTREYLCAVASECRDMGFDEVLLRSFTYPTRGNLEKIDDSERPVSKEEALAQFLEEMREALGEGMRLSVELKAEDVLAGHNSASGVDLARIVPLVDRLYVTGAADRADLDAALLPLLGERALEGFLVLEPVDSP